jgi:DNA-binding NarL/FixJ family response regulator
MILKGTSGSTVLRAIRDIDPDVAVILSSGYGLQGEVRSVMEMGCRGFIQKPYTIGDLSAIVQKVLAEEPGSR